MDTGERRRMSGRSNRCVAQWILLGIICVLSTSDNFVQICCQAFSFPKQVRVENSLSSRLQRGKLRGYFYRRTTTILSLYEKENDDDDENKAPVLPALGPASASSNNHCDGVASVEALSDAPAVAATTTVENQNETPTNTVQTFVNPKFALQYTCNICETKNRVIVSRQAYREGMVIAVCKGCNNKHWIADNLDPALSHSNIEQYFQSKGQGDTVNRVTEEVYEIERVWGLKEGEMTDESGDAVLE